MASASFPVTFPSALTLVSTQTLSDVGHADNLHNKDRAEIIAAQTKLGLGSSVANGSSVLLGTGGTASAWGPVDASHIGAGTVPMLKIAGTVLAGSVASVSFSGIPQTYRHLVLYSTARVSTSGTLLTTVLYQINGDSGSMYDRQLSLISGNGTVTSTNTLAQTAFNGAGAAQADVAGSFAASGETTFFNYAGSYAKIFHSHGFCLEGTAPSNCKTVIVDGAYRGTTAVGTITVSPVSGSFVPGCRFDLYGIPA